MSWPWRGTAWTTCSSSGSGRRCRSSPGCSRSAGTTSPGNSARCAQAQWIVGRLDALPVTDAAPRERRSIRQVPAGGIPLRRSVTAAEVEARFGIPLAHLRILQWFANRYEHRVPQRAGRPRPRHGRGGVAHRHGRGARAQPGGHDRRERRGVPVGQHQRHPGPAPCRRPRHRCPVPLLPIDEEAHADEELVEHLRSRRLGGDNQQAVWTGGQFVIFLMVQRTETVGELDMVAFGASP